MKELWQPDRELVSNTKTDTDVICIKCELGHTKHEESCPEALIDDDKAYTDLRNDREEIETSNQHANSEYYATKLKSMEESNGESGIRG